MPVSAARQWEEVDRVPPQSAEMRGDFDDGLIVTVHDGYVYCVVRQKINIKMFTILGQLIVQETLQPGSYRFKLNNRGIYLLKAGTATRRVTV